MKTFATLALWTLLAGPVLAQDPFAGTDPFLAAAPAGPTYAQAFAAHKRNLVPLVALFTTDNCLPCQQQKELFAAAEFPGAVVCQVHSSEAKVCAAAKVDQFPSVLVFLPDGSCYRFVGVTATEKIKRALAPEAAKPQRPFAGTRPTLVRNAAGRSSGFTVSMRPERIPTSAMRAEPCGNIRG